MSMWKKNTFIVVMVALALILAAELLMLGAVGERGETAVPSATVPPSAVPLAEHTPEPTPEPTAEPTPEPTPEPTAAETLLAGMTLREKICQMILARPEDITGVEPVTVAREATQTALEQYPVGGLIYDGSNMVTMEQVAEMLENTQSFSKIPLLLTCDEEGGRVNRLMHTVGTTYIGPMLDYRAEGVGTAFQNARTIAMDMAALGFNLDLAPVADVYSNPGNTVIGDRAYSDSFAEAAELVSSAVEGFHAGGVGCTLKHFPGHGDTAEDSHAGAAYVYKTLEELREEELLPFAAGIEAGADAVMIGHLVVTDISDEPALFSYAIVTELLREELGFDGVVMTDGLEMAAVTDNYTPGETAVRAVKAGVDMLLAPIDLEETIEALTGAVASGEITEERIDESVMRILSMKEALGLLG